MNPRRITAVAAVAVPDWRISPVNPAKLVAVSFWILDGKAYIHDLDGWRELDLPPVSKPTVTPGDTAQKPRKPRRR